MNIVGNTFIERSSNSEKTLLRNSLSDSDDVKLQKHILLSDDCIKKIYPSKTDLSIINNSIKCTEDKCEESFTSCSNLNLHLYKTHNKKDAIKFDSVIKQFHCPEIQCIYHQSEWFKTKKLLKQHYLKVHSPKTFICENCREGFPTKAFKNMHVDYCGVKFKCNDCPMNYPKYESLLTHARRKEHKINEKIYFKLNRNNNVPLMNISKSDSNLLKKLKPILAKPTAIDELAVNSNFFNKKNDQSIQTDYVRPKLKSKITQINRNLTPLNTRQTQTGFWKEQSTIETQTIGDYFGKIKVQHDEDLKQLITTQSSTQTIAKVLKCVSSNTFIPINDLGLPVNVKRSSSSTQTLQPTVDDNFSASKHDSVVTDTSDLMGTNLESFDTNYFNCNMETQTDSIFNEDLFVYGDYYSNMYTQTCEDLFLNSLELNHIETQTVDDMLKSVEIQTTICHKKPQINCRDISHMETQTEEFKQMLEAINA